jgi:hypothetical protein
VVDEAEFDCKKETVLRRRSDIFQGNEIGLEMEKTFLKQRIPEEIENPEWEIHQLVQCF